MAAHAAPERLGAFAIGFDQRDRARLHALWDEILTSNRWSQGSVVEAFEAAWEAWNGLPAVAMSSWSGAALAALEFAGVRGATVLCPSNTFMATPLAAQAAGAEVVFVDCNRDDLCASFADFEAKAAAHRPRAAFLVHIGGHVAFEVEQIAAFCRSEGIAFAFGRHGHVRNEPGHVLDQFAVRAISRDDVIFVFLAAMQRRFPIIEPEPAFWPFRAMAAEAGPFEDRFDVAGKMNLVRARSRQLSEIDLVRGEARSADKCEEVRHDPAMKPSRIHSVSLGCWEKTARFIPLPQYRKRRSMLDP